MPPIKPGEHRAPPQQPSGTTSLPNDPEPEIRPVAREKETKGVTLFFLLEITMRQTLRIQTM